MLALLKLIPLKDWVYCGLIAALLAGFTWYTFHERAVGQAHIKAADRRVQQAALIHNQEVETRAKTLTDAAVAAYKATVAAPAAADAPHLLCVAPGPDHVPAHAGDRPRAHAAVDVSDTRPADHESSVEHAVDIGPVLDKLHEDADAEVKALQAYVSACQAAGICLKPKSE
jgi:hypothetical protein